MMFGIDSLYIWLAVIIISVAVEAFTLTLCGIWFAAGGVAALIAASLSVPIFRASFHTIVTSRASYYAPPDTGVPNLILVASEQLPSIEGAVEILMDVPFLRGSL